MAALTTIITRETIIEFVPGAAVTIDDRLLKPYLRPAHKTVAAVIGAEVFNAVAGMTGTDMLKYLQAAVANRLMYDYVVFEAIQRRREGNQDTYKYEVEGMQSTYLDFYFDALDSLIGELNGSDTAGWAEAPASKAREKLLIRTTEEFDSLYGIDGSDFFFFKTIFLQEKVMDAHLGGIDLEALADDMLRRIKRVAAVFTVAYALRQFDFSMLPKTIRNASVDGAYRHSLSEQNTMYDLSEYLFGQAENDLSTILFEINAPEPGSDIPSTNNLNDPRKKYYLFS